MHVLITSFTGIQVIHKVGKCSFFFNTRLDVPLFENLTTVNSLRRLSETIKINTYTSIAQHPIYHLVLIIIPFTTKFSDALHNASEKPFY